MFTSAPYSAPGFNATPPLHDALKRHRGDEWVHEKIGPIFKKYGLEGVLGLTLLHHHFELNSDEFLTEVGGTATAWTSQTGAQPSIWSLEKDNIRPLEFAMDDDNNAVPYPDWNAAGVQQFLSELWSTFVAEDIAGIYGLGRYTGDNYPGRVEMTVGRANVNLTPLQASKYDSDAVASQAAWFFTEDFRKRGCACNCYHHGTGNSSHTHHQTRSG